MDARMAAAVRELMGDLRVAFDQAMESEAAGWVVLTLDCDSSPPKPVSVTTPFAQPEQALAEAARMDADPDTGVKPRDGDPGWQHVVLPMFTPDEAVVGDG